MLRLSKVGALIYLIARKCRFLFVLLFNLLPNKSGSREKIMDGSLNFSSCQKKLGGVILIGISLCCNI